MAVSEAKPGCDGGGRGGKGEERRVGGVLKETLGETEREVRLLLRRRKGPECVCERERAHRRQTQLMSSCHL